jgi:uncharacterized membrane-anchored protein
VNKNQLGNLIQAATAQGILPADAVPLAASRPWPIVLITVLGAWLAAMPLLLVIALLFGDVLVDGVACYFVAVFALVAAKFTMFANPEQDFVEQLGVPALLAGLGLLAFGLHRDLGDVRLANALLASLVLVIGWFVRQHWLRMVLGALACLAFMLMTCDAILIRQLDFWSATSFATLVWLVAVLCTDHSGLSGDSADKLLASESLSTGWILATLGMLVYGAGATFLSVAVLGFDYNMDGGARLSLYSLPRAVSCALALAALACLFHRWPAVHVPRYYAAATLVTAMSWLMPALGAPLLVLSFCASSSRWRLAVVSGVAATWIIGSFYYQLGLPLATKALVMIGMSVGFAIIAWRRRTGRAARVKPEPTLPQGGGLNAGYVHRFGIATSLLVTLLAANIGIWQKETLIGSGRQVFIALAPVDPRSLLQGDYMALNFQLPELQEADSWGRQRVKAVARMDGRGIAVIQGLAMNRPLQPDEIYFELRPTQSGLRPATDAWYFKEGEADRWAKASYGEFRVDRQGQALLVDLRGPNLEQL